MGLAASQARLLSITSRISDNELRAQLINNQKMRLSSESSQVSENYINALNKTNLVFANYDKDDNAQNVPLTFNNLTAFNQYNNQYGLTNAAGNILISEDEAKKYQASIGADDPQAAFLKQHGIEYTTSYWDEIEKQIKTDADNDGEPDSGIKYTATELKTMYEGDPTNNIPSYDDTIKTKEYNDFAAYADEFAMKMGELSNTQAEQASLQSKFISALVSGNSASPTTYTISSLNATTADNIATNIVNNFNTPLPTGFEKDSIKDRLSLLFTEDKFLEYINSQNGSKLEKIGSNYYSKVATGVTYTDNGTTASLGISADADKLQINPLGIGSLNGQSVGNVNRGSEAGNPTYSFTVNDSEDGSTHSSTYLYKNINTTTGKADVYSKIDTDTLNTLVTYYIQDKAQEVINEMLTAGGKINTSGQACTDAGFTAEEKSKLQNAAGSINGLTDIVNNIARILFDTNASSYVDAADIGKSAQKLNVILDYLTSGTAKWQTSGNQLAGKDLDGNDVNFNWAHLTLSQNVFNAYVIDTMMDVFGEPVYGYLYTNGAGKVQQKNGNIDASAEAKWFINLFDKIQSSGYQILANGLANSTDWLQFALENGIVVMEQVNSEDNWQGITYTSCSDISEQTDSTAATIAEAEYNKAMRQIEAKDEMFDLELKNIDTEHSSLEAEYESVKKAMSGNIERNFQMYS